MTRAITLEGEVPVSAVAVGAGDVLVLTLPHAATHEEFDHIYALMHDRFPKNACLVLDRGITLSVVRP